jgi:hypothetical protein
MLEIRRADTALGSGRRGHAHRGTARCSRGRLEGAPGRAPASASTRTKSCGPVDTARPRSRRCGARASWRMRAPPPRSRLSRRGRLLMDPEMGRGGRQDQQEGGSHARRWREAVPAGRVGQ